MKRILIGLMITIPLCLLPPHAAPPDEAPDLILHGGAVIQVEGPAGGATALAIRGNRITFVGGDTEALALKGPGTRIVELGGRTVIPGLIDAHGHVSSLGFAAEKVDALATRSAGEVAELVKEAATRIPPGEWIRGRGWDQNDWADTAFPTREILDRAAPAHPVVLERIDGHAIWVNTRALEVAGISRKAPDPPGGMVHRDGEGFPTGILVDNAAILVEAKIPAPGRERRKAAILRALNLCLDAGLTGVHDAGISMEEAALYRELAAEGALPIRVYAMLGGNSRSLGDYFPHPPASGLGNGFLDLRAIKLGIDGALGSRGAALMEDYADDSGNRGLITRPAGQIRSLALQAASKGFQVCVHSIGDRGNKLALDALGQALAEGPAGDHRFRIEHAQVLRLEDIPRFRATGIIPSMQPTHCTSDMPWAEERLGRRRARGAYAWRRLLDTGVRIPGGSDFPVESENPFFGLYAAITRQDAGGQPPGGWHPEERLSPLEALRSFTLDAAYAAFWEKDLGSVTTGKKADLVILRGNPLEIAPRDLLSMKPEAVLVDGRVARVAPSLAGKLPHAESH
jgi:predicted amidohydrolase YtcJ